MISPKLSTLDHEKILHALGIYESSAPVGNDQSVSDLPCAQQDSIGSGSVSAQRDPIGSGSVSAKQDPNVFAAGDSPDSDLPYARQNLNSSAAFSAQQDSGSGQADTQFKSRINAQISQCEDKLLHVCRPRAVYRILPVSSIDPALMTGNDIRRLLSGCSEAVLMALTLGAELERLLIREEVSNMSDAYVLDVCASEAVEEAADDFEDQLRSELKAQNRYLTNRYSPGYGDYPLSIQRLLLDSVNAMRAIGLTLTPTNLMVPRKSITAVMGISDQPKPEVYGGCTHCPIRDKCSFRRHGRRCFMES